MVNDKTTQKPRHSSSIKPWERLNTSKGLLKEGFNKRAFHRQNQESCKGDLS